MKVYLGILLCIGLLVAALAFPWDSVYRVRAGWPRAVEEGLAGLRSESFEERERSALELRSIGEAARPALLAAARNGRGETRRRAAAILRMIQRDGESLSDRRQREFHRIVTGGINRADMLGRETVRFRILSLDPPHAARATVRVATRNQENPLRLQRCVILLRELNDPSGAGFLADILAKGWVLPSTLYHASEGLRSFGSAQLGPRLRAAVSSEDPESRKYAVRVLAIHGRPEDLPVVRRAAGDREERVRVAAADALAHVGGSESIVDLMGLTEDGAPAVRTAALLALLTVPGAPAREAAMSALVDAEAEVRVAALKILRARGIEGDVALVRSLLVDPSPRVRGEAIRTVSALGGRYAAVRTGLKDRSPAVRRLALIAAKKLSEEDRAVVRQLAQAEPDPYLRRLRDKILGSK